MHTGGLDLPLRNVFDGSAIAEPITAQWGSREGTLTLGYAVRPWLAVRVQGTHGDEIHWESTGYRGPFEDVPPTGVFFSAEADMHTVGAVLVAVSAGPLRVGVGPSITRIQVQAWSPAESFAPTTESRVGWVLELGASLPLGRRFLADLSLQRHWVGSEEIGPYPLHDLSGQLSTTYPATRVSFDHTFFKVGLGVRW
jgi:hypothetical protein